MPSLISRLADPAKRWRHRLREDRFGLEIAEGAVRGVRLRPVVGGWRLAGRAEAPLPEGVLGTAFRGPGLTDPAALAAAVGAVMDRLGGRNRRVRVALPDALAKLRVESMPALPADPAEVRRLGAWHLARVFRMTADELRVDLHPVGSADEGEAQVWAAAAARSVIQEFEAALQGTPVDPEPMLPAVLARFNLHAEELPDDGTGVFLVFTEKFAHLMLLEAGRPTVSQSVRGGIGNDRLGRDLFLVAEHIRDRLAGRAVGAVHLADPGPFLWDLAGDIEGLFAAPLTILRTDGRLVGADPSDAELPALSTAIGAAIGDHVAGDAS
jgi:hypothetical protein